MSSTPRRRDCRFSSVSPKGSRPSTGASMDGEGDVRLLDGDHLEVDAQPLGQRAGVVARALARVARRHGEAVHAVRPERVDGDGRHERGVDPARQADHGVGEAVLGAGSPGCRGRAPRTPRRGRSAPGAAAPGRAAGRSPGRGSLTTILRQQLGDRVRAVRPDGQVDHDQVVGELRARRQRASRRPPRRASRRRRPARPGRPPGSRRRWRSPPRPPGPRSMARRSARRPRL